MADSKNPDEQLEDSSSDLTPNADDAQASKADDAVADEVADQKKAKPVKRNQTVAPVKKAKPSKKEEHSDKIGPVRFTKQAIGELKKVVWPSGEQTGQSFVVVLFFVLLMMAIVAGLDALFGWALIEWLG